MVDIMTEIDARKILEQDGFTQLYVHADGPNFLYPEHGHPVDTTHIIITGTMMIEQEGKEIVLQVGDRMNFPKGIFHAAKMGPQGCTFITGIRI